MKRELIIVLLFFVAALGVVGPQPISAQRLAECDACGYCQNKTPPSNWKECAQCIYPSLGHLELDDPTSHNKTLIVDPTYNRVALQPAKGKYYTQLGCIDTSLDSFQDPGASGGVLNFLLTKAVFPIVGVLAFIYLIYGAAQLALSRGDYQQLQEGKKTVTGAVIGLVFTLSIILLIGFVGGSVLKIPFLSSSDPTTPTPSLSPGGLSPTPNPTSGTMTPVPTGTTTPAPTRADLGCKATDVECLRQYVFHIDGDQYKFRNCPITASGPVWNRCEGFTEWEEVTGLGLPSGSRVSDSAMFYLKLNRTTEKLRQNFLSIDGKRIWYRDCDVRTDNGDTSCDSIDEYVFDTPANKPKLPGNNYKYTAQSTWYVTENGIPYFYQNLIDHSGNPSWLRKYDVDTGTGVINFDSGSWSSPITVPHSTADNKIISTTIITYQKNGQAKLLQTLNSESGNEGWNRECPISVSGVQWGTCSSWQRVNYNGQNYGGQGMYIFDHTP